VIENPLLALVARHIANLAASGDSAEIRNAEQAWLEQALATEAHQGVSWRKLLLDTYCGLERNDLASMPLRAHHWLIERVLAAGPDDIRVRNGFFSDLFALLDPFGRHLAIKVLVDRNEFVEQLPALLGRLSVDNSGDRPSPRVQEVAEIVLDLRFGESQMIRERAAARGLSPADRAVRALVRWSRQHGQADAVGAAVRNRAARAGGETGAELTALFDDREGFDA
jgi:hypothetical protein